MLCASVVALAGLTSASLTFFVWCWLEFKSDRELHPIYKAKKFSSSSIEQDIAKKCA